MKEFRANFPAPPDPANTEATKQPVKQYFSAKSTADGVETVLLPETELELTETQSPWVQGAEEADVTISLFYKDASGLPGPAQTQTFKLPAAPDNIPPDAPGPFGEIEVRDVATV